MPNYRMNKTIAGYHLLMILCAVDYKFKVVEDLVIRDWLIQEFPFKVNLDNQMEVLSRLSPDEWMPHFQKCMDDYYLDATSEEQHDLINFAVKVIKADNHITIEENEFFNHLMNTWHPENY